MQKDLGAILLVAGTTIGAGMLALPAATSPLGFYLAIVAYIAVFALMYVSALHIVKLVLHFEKPCNFVELAHQTLGLKGKAFCWIIYLLLMYALLAAYMSASSSMVSVVFTRYNLVFSESFAVLLLPISFVFFVSYGLRALDLCNRFLMAALLLSFFLLCLLLVKQWQLDLGQYSPSKSLKSVLPIMITSFGYHIIIPTVSNYLKCDKKRIHRALFIGSLIPLFIYILWHVVICLNLTQAQLEICIAQDIPITELLAQKYPQIKPIAFAFAFSAILTSFIGVALSLFDFLKDSLPKHEAFKNKKILFSLTFLPPLIYLFYFKKAFYMALDHAGILVSLLLLILPSVMYLKIKGAKKPLPLIVISVGIYVIIMDIIQNYSF